MFTRQRLRKKIYANNISEKRLCPGVDDGQGGLACCSSWGHEESDGVTDLN